MPIQIKIYIRDFFALVSASSSPHEKSIWAPVYIIMTITTIHTNPFIQLIIVTTMLLNVHGSTDVPREPLYTAHTINADNCTNKNPRTALSMVDFVSVAACSSHCDVMSR